MEEHGDTVYIPIQISPDGSGHSIYREHERMPATVIKTPDETHWSKYHLIIEIGTLVEELNMSESEITETLQLREENGVHGYFVAPSEGYVKQTKQ